MNATAKAIVRLGTPSHHDLEFDAAVFAAADGFVVNAPVPDFAYLESIGRRGEAFPYFVSGEDEGEDFFTFFPLTPAGSRVIPPGFRPPPGEGPIVMRVRYTGRVPQGFALDHDFYLLASIYGPRRALHAM